MKKRKENISNQAEYEHRVETVADMILAGLSRFQIIQQIRTNHKLKWDVIDRQIDNYISDAKESIRSSTKTDKGTEVSKAIRRYEMLHAQALNHKDFKTCAIINEKLTKLLGIAEPTENQTDNKIEIQIRRASERDMDK